MTLAMKSDAIPQERFAIAFSGGGDSTALVHRLRDRHPLILIVDHGLRHGSDKDALATYDFATGLGLTADILTWSPPPMTTGLQAKARKARYGLLGEACRRHGVTYLLTGHTQDDQAETTLMRVQSGQGWRGAAGMQALTPAPIWPELAGLTLCRPMLGISREAIRDYLTAHKLPYVDDPSNKNVDFERVRARQTLLQNPTHREDMLQLSSELQIGREMERARLAGILKTQIRGDEFGNLFFLSCPPTALLGPLIRAVSGSNDSPRRDALLRLKRASQTKDFNGASLGGALLSPYKGGFMLARDPVIATGRGDVTALAPYAFDGTTLWDGRFWISGEGALSPTGEQWIDAPQALRKRIKTCPLKSRATLPLWTRDGKVIAIGPYDRNGARLASVRPAILQRLYCAFGMKFAEPNDKVATYVK